MHIINKILIGSAAVLFVAVCVSVNNPANRATIAEYNRQQELARAAEHKRQETADAERQKREAKEKAAQAVQSRIDTERYLAERRAHDFVEARLKAPSTASFGDAKVVPMGGGEYLVSSYVDAQNAFGAMLRTHYDCTVRTTDGGDHFRLVNLRTY